MLKSENDPTKRCVAFSVYLTTTRFALKVRVLALVCIMPILTDCNVLGCVALIYLHCNTIYVCPTVVVNT